MKYIVNDNEAGNFMEWTHEKPMTRKEIIQCFKSMSDDEDLSTDKPIPLKDFNLKMIQSVWNVSIIKHKEATQ